MFTGLIIGSVILGGLLLAVAPKSAKQVYALIRAKAGKVGRAAEKIDPLAQFEQGISDAQEIVTKAKGELAKVKTMVATVERQVANDQSEHKRLTIRIQRAIADQQEDRARQYAGDLAQVEKRLGENQKLLGLHNNTYETLRSTVQNQIKKIADYRREAETLGAQLKVSEVEKELGEMTRSFNLDNAGLNKLGGIRENILNKISENRAVGQVESDVGGVEVIADEEAELDRNIEADEILKRFRPQASAPTQQALAAPEEAQDAEFTLKSSQPESVPVDR